MDDKSIRREWWTEAVPYACTAVCLFCTMIQLAVLWQSLPQESALDRKLKQKGINLPITAKGGTIEVQELIIADPYGKKRIELSARDWIRMGTVHPTTAWINFYGADGRSKRLEIAATDGDSLVRVRDSEGFPHRFPPVSYDE